MSDPNSVLIVAGGAAPGGDFTRRLAGHYAKLIAADAGLAVARECGLEPDAVIGDFDSVDPALLETVRPERRHHEPAQDDSDLEKAIRLALHWGAERIGLAGCSGDRIDHTFNAVSLMIRYADRAHFVLHDAHGDGMLGVAPEVSIRGRPGTLVSLVPAPAAHGLESEGLKYPLGGIDLVFGGRDGISNELVAETARVTMASGRILVYVQHH